jgi:transposase
MDHESRSGVPKKKRRCDRLIGLTELNEDWVLGFEDEVWWSRLALPSVHSFSEKGKPLRLVKQSVAKDDPDPKAISCYGLYLPELEKTWLRFVDGRPVSAITTQFLKWCCQKLEAIGKKVWVLVWDNASWHISHEVRNWIDEHNRTAKKSGKGVRIIRCQLPKQSPWLNPIEPKWLHGKRKVMEVDRLLSAHELVERVCEAFDCPHYEHLSITEKVA